MLASDGYSNSRSCSLDCVQLVVHRQLVHECNQLVQVDWDAVVIIGGGGCDCDGYSSDFPSVDSWHVCK